MRFGKLSMSLLCFLVVALVLPGLVLAQVGKLRGTVVDKENGDPLYGANVSLENTNWGAATDVNGEYIILNVPAGKYNLVISYMGYKKTVIQDVIVTSGLTAYQDIEMEQEVLEGQEVVITAEKPLIEKGKTNEVQVVRGEDMQHMPIRGVNAAISQMAGVVNDGGLHVRGGRNNQTVYYVDGVNTSNAFGGESMTSVIHGAIEEVQMQTGGYGAAFGGKMSGVAMAQTKTGRKNYHFTLEGISDDFWAIKNDAGSYQILGIDKLYSYGYNDYTLTASGPIFPSMDKIRFFVALEHSYVASSATRFAGFNQDSIKVTSVSNPLATTSGVPQQKDTTWYYVDAPPGRLPGGGNTSSTINSNLVFDFQPIRFQLGFNGNITRSTPQSSYPTSLVTVNEAGTSRNHPYNYMAYIKLTHTIDPTMFYTLQASYSKRGNNYGPVDMPWDLNAENYAKFGDPSYASGLIDTGKGYGSFYLPFESTWSIPHYYMNDSLAGGVPSTYGTIGMWEETKTMFKLDLSKQIGSAHEIRFGGEYTQGLYRTFSIDARSYLWTKRTVDLEPESYTSFDFWSSLSNFIGYDAQGNPVDDDQTVYTKKGLEDSVAINIHNAPAKPKNLSLYLEDQIELKDLIINAGVRYEYMNYGHYSLTNLDSLTKVTGGVIDEKYFGDPRVYEYLLPRLGFSFPITDQAVFTAHYGKYIQRPSINDTYTNEAYLAGFLYQLYGGHYFNPLPSPNLKPERTTEYQFGFKMLFGTNAALKLVAFYRNQQDLITYRHVIPLTVDYTTQTMYQNGDFATIKGVSATFDLRRTERVSARINYTYQVAKGSGSDAGTHASIAWQEMDPHFPRLIYPLNYDQRHKGTAVVDIRTLDNDGPEIFGTHPLGNIGLNLLFAFHSGSPFTRIPMGDAFSSLYGFNAPPPVEAPNSSRMPWFYQLDMKLEKAFNIGSLRMIAFLRGINILDLKSYTNVFQQTGRPDTDGWLNTNAGKNKIDAMKNVGGVDYSEDYIKWYNASITNCGTASWQTPRQLRLGVRVEL